MTISTAAHTITLANEGIDYDENSADNVSSYDRVVRLSEGTSSAHGVRVFADDRQLASAIILAGGGASGIHPRSAFVHAGSLFLAVGPFVVCLDIPSLNTLWSVETDDATCFGVHRIPESSDFISHGELSIARVTDAGRIVWSESGADILTGDLAVLSEGVRVTDFEGRSYSFDLVTGASKLLSPA